MFIIPFSHFFLFSVYIFCLFYSSLRLVIKLIKNNMAVIYKNWPFHTFMRSNPFHFDYSHSHTCCSHRYWSTSTLEHAHFYNSQPSTIWKQRWVHLRNNNVFTMEDILLNIVKEATGSKLSSLKQSAQEANGSNYLRRMLRFVMVCL